MQDQLDLLDRRVADLVDRAERTERAAAVSAPAVREVPVATQSVPAPPAPVASAPPPPPWLAPDEVTAQLKGQLDSLTEAAEAQAARRAAERQAKDALSAATGRLALGETEGVPSVLESAAASLGGAAAEELRAATRSLENEDLITARQHIELALLNAR